ncbi:hypothetical protein D3C86_1891160 [compost metagenome]
MADNSRAACSLLASAACSWNQRSARNSGWLRLAWYTVPLREAVLAGESIWVRLSLRSAPAERLGSKPARAWGTTSRRAW